MGKNEAKIKFTAETGGFNDTIKKANSEMTQFRAELTLNDAQMKSNGASVEALENKHKILSNQLAAAQSKTEALSQKVNKAAELFGENSTEVGKLRTQLLNAQTAEERIKQAMSACNDELEAQRSAENQVETATEKLSRTIEEQESELNKLKSRYVDAVLQYGKTSSEAKTLAKQINTLSDDLSDNQKQMSYTESAADKLDNTLDETGDSAKEASEGFTVMKGAMADLVADGVQTAAEALTDVGTEAFTMSNDIDKATNTFIARTGASVEAGKEFEGIMTDIYNNNFGESFEDIADSMATVKTNLGDMDGGTLQKMTEGAILLRDTFGFEVNETTRTASMLMKSFGIDGETAYSMIATGAQNGLDKNGDLLDTLNEYSVHYKSLGYDVGDMLNMLSNGTESGTFSVDKLGDAVKEFGIRTKDTSKTTTEGFELIGLDADKMRKKFAAGGDSAQEATKQTLDALFNMDDQVKQNQAGVALFGTQWEDLGIDGVKALMDVNGEVEVSKDTLSTLNEVKYDDIGSTIEGVKRNLQTSIVETFQNEVMPAVNNFVENVDWGSVGQTIGETFGAIVDGAFAAVEAVKQATQWMKEHKEIVIAVAAVIGVLTTAIAAYNIAQGIKAAMDAVQVTTVWGLVAAHWAQATAAMAAFAPYLLAVAAIAAVIAIIILCIKYWDEIVAACTFAWESIKSACSSAWEAIKTFFSSAWEAIKSGVSSAWEAIKTFFSSAWESIKLTCSSAWEAIKSFFLSAWESIKLTCSSAWEAIKSFFSSAWEAIKLACSSAWEAIKSTFSSAWEAIKLACSTAWEAIKTAITTVWNGIKTTITTVLNAIKTVITTVWNFIKTSITTTLNTVKTVITTIWNGIQNTISSVVNGIKSVISSVWNSISSTISGVLSGIQTTVSDIWNGIKTSISDAITNVQTTVTDVFNNIKTTVSEIFSNMKETIVTVGGDLISGLWNGINDKFNWIVEKIKGFTNGVTDKLKSFFGIKSPSRVMRDEVGKMLAEGVAVGVIQKTDVAADAAGNLGKEVLMAAQKSLKKGKATAEDLGKEVMKVAKQKFEEYQTYNEMTLADEVAFWDAIRIQCTEGTAARLEADQKYFEAKNAIDEKILETAEKRLDEYQTYNEMTLADEVAFWDAIRIQCTEGTDARLNADKKYLEAKKTLNDELLLAEDTLQAELEEIQQRVIDRTNEITGAFSLFESFKFDDVMHKEDMLTNLDAQVHTLQNYQTELEKLENRIGGTALFEEIANMGVNALPNIYMINSMTEKQLEEMVELYNQRTELAKELATDELAESTLAETAEAYNTYTETCASLGIDVSNQIATTMNDTVSSVSSALAEISKKFENFSPKMKMPHFEIKGSFSINPPSVPRFNVEWFKDGGIFTRPTIFNTPYGLKGVGEAGAEAVLPIDRLEGYISGAIEKAQNTVNLQVLANAIDNLANRPVEMYVNGRQFAVATAGDSDSVNGLRNTFLNRGLAL